MADSAESIVTIVDRAQQLTLEQMMRLPERVQRILGGRPVAIDGQTLAADLQLQLRLQRVARQPGAETKPIPEGREVLRHPPEEPSMATGHELTG